jgi:elongation factor 2
MGKFTIEEIANAMNIRTNIRNLTIAAHVDSGKTSTTDSLLNKAGLISDDSTGTKRATDTRKDEQERCITIKSTSISLYYELSSDVELPADAQGNKFLINLIDSPGHVDFSAEVTASLRVSDNALVILDAIKGCAAQTITVLRQALDEMIKPVCLINKLDRLILELGLSPEEIYQKFVSHINNLNGIIYKFNQKMPEIILRPEDGTVAFGCATMGWGFSLSTIARQWATKMGMPAKELMKYLWGENYYHPKENKWYETKVAGSIRGFNYCCMGTIMQIIKTVNTGKNEDITNMIEKMHIKIDEKHKVKTGKQLLKPIMQKFMPYADPILEMVITKLPSPIEAQKYRVDQLYTGPKGDIYYNAIRDCDPNGPLMMYVSKLFPAPDLSRFYAFGRIFSGTVKADQVCIQSPDYIPNIGGPTTTNKLDYKKQRISQVNIMMAAKAESLTSACCGNLVSLSGVDGEILKTATITDAYKYNNDAYNIRDMKFAVSPVVNVAITPKQTADLPKLVKGMKLLSKSDPMCHYKLDEDTGEIIISGSGELHLEICIHDLRTMFTKNVEIIVSDPVVPFRETVTDLSSQVCLAKSANNHNRLYLTAEPIGESLIPALEHRIVTNMTDLKEKTRILGEHGWARDEVSKIWGISTNNMNIFVDSTRGLQYVNEIRDSVVTGFNHSTMRGVLCAEPIIGVKYSLKDVTLHTDAIHRGGGQILPATNKVICASMLMARPRLMEPIYLVEIECPVEMTSKIYSVFSQRKGTILDEENDAYGAKIKGHLPVCESIGFTAFLRAETQGKAFPQCSFSHWQIIDDDPLVKGTRSNELVEITRKRKGMKSEVPPVTDFLDKL